MQVTILYFNGCPMWETAAARVRTVLAELGRVDVAVQVEDAHQMSPLPSEWAGSPTLLVNGHDPFAAADDPLPARDACRIYVTEAGFDGAPSVDQLRKVLTLAFKDDTTSRRN